MQKKCCICKVSSRTRAKYNVGKPVSLYEIEWCSLYQNPYVDDIVLLY